MKPVLIIGAGPVGLTSALALAHYGIPFQIFEEDASLSQDTKAGTVLTRTLEAFRRFGVAEKVLSRSVRVDEISEIERASNAVQFSIRTDTLKDETRFPFVINIPQHHLEPILSTHLDEACGQPLRLQHRLVSYEQTDDGVVAIFDTPSGPQRFEGSYLLGCDGGRSSVREMCGVTVEGVSLDVRYMLVDLKVDLDVTNPRDYPYLAYFSDENEWMILVRQPHCWRFLYPLERDASAPSKEELKEKALRFIGDANDVEVLGTVVYNVHHRIATRWRDGRVFLMGDAAHLITPMWALGMNTGVLDAISLSWRLAWVMRGWAGDDLLDGYEREQRPVASEGSGEMAEAARSHMAKQGDARMIIPRHAWGNACTRTLLGIHLDLDGSRPWSMVRNDAAPPPLCVGDRLPDFPLQGADGRALRLHDLVDKAFVALHFVDARRRPPIPESTIQLKHYAVSRWDAPLDSGLRDISLFDPGDALRKRLGIEDDCVVLVRPDDYVAAMLPAGERDVQDVYGSIVASSL
ncbi:Pentachlorophenol 4-monooxygenase [compost metagenome]